MENQIRKNLISLNDLSKDIYGEETRLSAILKMLEFEEEQIIHLQTNGLCQMLDYIDCSLRSSLLTSLSGEKLLYTLYHRYSLFGYEKKTLEEISKRYGVSGERVRQWQNKAVKNLRRVFKMCVAISACKTLNTDIYKTKFFAVSAASADESCQDYKKSDSMVSALTDEIRSAFKLSDTPLRVNEIVSGINYVKSFGVDKLRRRDIIDFFVGKGILQEAMVGGGRFIYEPTKAGAELGIFTEERIGFKGTYKVVLYSREAQEFLIDNIDAVVQIRASDDRYTSQGKKWTSQEDEQLRDLFSKSTRISEIALILKRTPIGIRARLKRMGLIENRSDPE